MNYTGKRWISEATPQNVFWFIIVSSCILCIMFCFVCFFCMRLLMQNKNWSSTRKSLFQTFTSWGIFLEVFTKHSNRVSVHLQHDFSDETWKLPVSNLLSLSWASSLCPDRWFSPTTSHKCQPSFENHVVLVCQIIFLNRFIDWQTCFSFGFNRNENFSLRLKSKYLATGKKLN